MCWQVSESGDGASRNHATQCDTTWEQKREQEALRLAQ
ncbi:MAG: hypothetical protein AVDCRST_MAG87-1417 [uncultured Thermomicrobiales bacterium]|uniref:Uncharacterized protein n=1 Tax=uncultured Thermomicrobiales bacterium TaxID=1645740 RepID=A0A6J4USU6_9BACT|nr:MAG: hypothetical protein AVDCRST_MAG87-1417 [uncultured Thermomicrobiales bacterium]